MCFTELWYCNFFYHKRTKPLFLKVDFGMIIYLLSAFNVDVDVLDDEVQALTIPGGVVREFDSTFRGPPLWWLGLLDFPLSLGENDDMNITVWAVVIDIVLSRLKYGQFSPRYSQDHLTTHPCGWCMVCLECSKSYLCPALQCCIQYRLILEESAVFYLHDIYIGICCESKLRLWW